MKKQRAIIETELELITAHCFEQDSGEHCDKCKYKSTLYGQVVKKNCTDHLRADYIEALLKDKEKEVEERVAGEIKRVYKIFRNGEKIINKCDKYIMGWKKC